MGAAVVVGAAVDGAAAELVLDADPVVSSLPQLAVTSTTVATVASVKRRLR
ncbi:MAG: hypothetical protein ACK5CE_12930 [Actinomycetes bacterium]